MSSLVQENIMDKRELSFVSITSEGTEVSVDNLSINSDEKRSPRSIYSTPSVSSIDVPSDRRYLPLNSYTEYFFDYHRKRSPSSKIYLKDIKERLIQEVQNIDKEVATIDTEKRTLLGIHAFLESLRNSLWESERNSQGLLVPEKLKGIIEKAVVDLGFQESAISKESNVPFFTELCKGVKKVSSTSEALQQVLSARIKIEDVEELFSQAGNLYGIVDSILMIFYEKLEEIIFKTPKTSRCESNVRSRTQSASKQKVLENAALDETDSGVCVKCMEHMTPKGIPSSPLVCNQSAKRIDNENGITKADDNVFTKCPSLTDSGLGIDIFGPYDENDQNKDNLVELTKDISKVKKHLKVIDRMTSGRPKMKFLIKKFDEIRFMLKLDENKDFKRYFFVFDENLNQLNNVLKIEKPNQCDLDNTRFLLSQLSGRATIVLKLESDGLY